MLVFSSEGCLWFSISDLDPKIIYEGEFGEPDLFKAYWDSTQACHHVIMLINKIFYLRIIEHSGNSNEWISIPTTKDEIPIDFVRLDHKCALLALYSDGDMMIVTTVKDRKVVSTTEKFKYLNSNPNRPMDLKTPLIPMYHEHDGDRMMAISSDKSLTYTFAQIGVKRLTAVVFSDKYDEEIINRYSDAWAARTLSSNGDLKINGCIVADRILKTQNSNSYTLALSEDLVLYQISRYSNVETITISNVSNFHHSSGYVIYTIEGENLVKYSTLFYNRKVIFTGQVRFQTTSSYDNLHIKSRNIKSANS